jgi:hypothetical protein
MWAGNTRYANGYDNHNDNDNGQAGLTDNPPVYVLGGNIVPLSVNGTNTTAAARAGNLTLLAALPGAQLLGSFERCGQGCAASSQPGNLVTCGHMYLDGGETCPIRQRH